MLSVALLLACTSPDVPVETGETQCEPVAWFADEDGDGHGGEQVWSCEIEPGMVEGGGDCDDADPAVWPGAVERCNGVDDDCDGVVDPPEVLAELYADADGDGLGDPAAPVHTCPGVGLVDNDCDCDDADAVAGGDRLACPALECPEEGGVWARMECNEALAVPVDDELTVVRDAALTLCDASHPLKLVVDTDRVVVHGQGREATRWTGTPALTVSRAGARVEVLDLDLGGASLNGGLLVDARAGDVDLAFFRAGLGSSSASALSATAVSVSGDLHLVDSVVDRIDAGLSSSYSNTCVYTGVSVSGDLELVRTTVGPFSLFCGSWTHSAWDNPTFTGVVVGGDARVEDSLLQGHDYSGSSSGVGDTTVASVLWVKGDLEATGLEAVDNALTSYTSCARYQCSRSLTGGVVRVDGSASLTGGRVDANTVALTGEMVGDGVFYDTLDAAPLFWTGQGDETLTLDGVDLGADASPDLAGTVEYDGEGLTSVVCTAAGCS